MPAKTARERGADPEQHERTTRGRSGSPRTRTSQPKGAPRARTLDREASEPPTVTVRIFDADRSDSILALDEALGRKIGDRQLLWIDVLGAIDTATGDAIAAHMALGGRTRRDLMAQEAPHISVHGTYFHVRVTTAPDPGGSGKLGWLDLIASREAVLTTHAGPIGLLVDLDRRIETDSTVGQSNGFAFVRSVLDAVVTGYLRMVDEIEDDIDDLDGLALRTSSDADLLSRLVAVRRRIASIRRLLSRQREIFAALGSADLQTLTEGDDLSDFQAVAARFESALGSVEESRDLLIGSFDVFMTRTAQRTNEVMKVLALATVLLLPGSLISGLLGMNVDVPLPRDTPWSFWGVVAAIAVLALLVILVARARRWI